MEIPSDLQNEAHLLQRQFACRRYGVHTAGFLEHSRSFLQDGDCLVDYQDAVNLAETPGKVLQRIYAGSTEGLTMSQRAVAKVIRRWINDNGRWNSPKYLGGESYGTTRTAMVVRELEGATYNDVGLNGLILISTILDFAAREPTPGNEMAYIVTLPNMAAAAWFHGKAEAAAHPEADALMSVHMGWGRHRGTLRVGEHAGERHRHLAERVVGVGEVLVEDAHAHLCATRREHAWARAYESDTKMWASVGFD